MLCSSTRQDNAHCSRRRMLVQQTRQIIMDSNVAFVIVPKILTPDLDQLYDVKHLLLKSPMVIGFAARTRHQSCQHGQRRSYSRYE